jgi:hypothetical protein
LSEPQRRLRQDEEKPGDQEELKVLQIVELNSPDAIHVFVGRQLFGARVGIEDRFLDVLRRAKSAFDLHTTVSHDIMTALRIMIDAATA